MFKIMSYKPERISCFPSLNLQDIGGMDIATQHELFGDLGLNILWTKPKSECLFFPVI